MRDSLPAASAVFASLPQAREDAGPLRESIRAMRAADNVLVGVIDDDPTGSQAVHDVQVVTAPDEDTCAAALDGPIGTCFLLTNSRSVGEQTAAELTATAARCLVAAAGRLGARVELVSRSDSTLRGHVLAEVAALARLRWQTAGAEPDAVLFVPAFIEAGRVTANGIHWARASGELVPVGETEFARDRLFGYAASDLRDFLAEKSRGAIRREDIASVGLIDIRQGGPDRVRDVLAGLRHGTWVVVDAVEYSDLEAVACGVLLAEEQGRSFLFRTGPSFVRALAGLEPKAPLRGAELAPNAGGGGHGLIVVGSHVTQTSRQMADLMTRGWTVDVELDVPAVISGARDTDASVARQVTDALGRSDVLLYTSRTLAASSGRDGFAAGRAVSATLARIVREALAAGPAWIVAKGGITSHDLAVDGLGMRRAVVAGQMFPGLISVFRPVDAAPAAMGMPYVVFPGNVGDDQALTKVVEILRDSKNVQTKAL
jgi:uncharacterized protein YgbK (DUF1537 family)